jgi:DNA-binding MarR family transcriptional regulator
MSFPYGDTLIETVPAVPAAPTEIERAALDSLRRVVRALRVSNTATRREYRLTAAQVFVLRQVAEHPGQSLSDLAHRTLTTQSTVSEVVGRLVQQGMMRRDDAPEDRRRAVLTLTRLGEEVLLQAPETVQERLVDGFRTLSAPVQSALAAGLDAWLTAAGLDAVPATMFLEE